MGQSWCKEKTTKAEDSKSPLDRVFVRCAHRIYPSLKEEGSVLGGATQRVTSSEIGYAGSPPREILTRGRSIDSVDRPFHPSEWVDVNLEVPSTPRASSVLTNLTADTSLYPATCTPTSSCSNLKDITPVPPPRHKKKNRGRPLPPKPDDIPQVHNSITKSEKDSKEEPLYSSVNHSKLRNDYVQDEEGIAGQRGTTKSDSSAGASEDSKNGVKRGKEIYEHKVNGTGRIIPSVVVSGKKTSRHLRNEDGRHGSREAKGHHKVQDDEYDKFSRIQSSRDTSTPTKNENERIRDLRMLITELSDREARLEVPGRSKNYSTVSLPNYDELEVVKHEVERSGESERTREGEKGEDEDAEMSKKPRRKVSTGSLPAEPIFSSVSQKTAERVENYVTRCRSFGSLLPHQILDKLKSEEERISDCSDDDEWDGLDDWDLGVVEHCGPNDGLSPLEPSSRLCERKVSSPRFSIGREHILITKKENGKLETVINVSSNVVSNKDDKVVVEKKSNEMQDTLSLIIPKDAAFEAPKSPNSLKSALKISTPTKLTEGDSQGSPTNLDDWFLAAQERSVRFSDSPTTEKDTNASNHKLEESRMQTDTEKDLNSRNYLFSTEPKEPIHINSFFEFDEAFGGTTNTIDCTGTNPTNSSRLDSSKILKRSLSNESEPFDGYEEKELVIDIQSQSSMSKLSRTISEESLPLEMLEDDDRDIFFDDKIVKDVRNKMTKESAISNESKNSKTPPPSPEPKIRAEILDNDHSTLLKVLKEEAADESNLSSMTPSLTELEAALSDMLERENKQDDVEDEAEETTNDLNHSESGKSLDVSIEPKIVPIEKEKAAEDILPNSKKSLADDKVNPNSPIALDRILNGSRSVSRESLASFSGQNEPRTTIELDSRNGGRLRSERNSVPKGPGPSEGKFASEIVEGIFKKSFGDPVEDHVESLEIEEHRKDVKVNVNPFDEPPEKPSRLHRVNLEESTEKDTNVPTPPRRKHRSNSNVHKDDITYRTTDYTARDPDLYPNDRLI